MGLTDRLGADLRTAMRAGDAARRDTLRMALAAARLAEKEKRASLSDDEAVALISREVKRRRESIEAYDQAGRSDLAAQERAEVAILAAYLPEQLGEDELLPLVLEVIDETAADSPRDMGRVMATLMPRVRGRADGKVLRDLVTRELTRSADPDAPGGGNHPAGA